MTRKLGIGAVLLLALAAAAVLAWSGLDLPPPRLLLAHGLPSGQGPTGRRAVVGGIEFVEISPGYFRMGSELHAVEGDLLGRICGPLGLPFGTPAVPSDEMPLHWVELPRGFWIARTETTNAQYWWLVDESLPDTGSPDERQPMVCVSWHEAKRLCALLGERTGLPVRLPTEAEWECACRAGSATEYCFGDNPARLPEFAWFGLGSGEPHPVGELRPNAWGLYDLHGNVWEWCEDSGDPGYASGPPHGGTGPAPPGELRVLRGGAYHSPADYCRSAIRFGRPSEHSWRSLGFRFAFSPGPGEERLVEPYLERE